MASEIQTIRRPRITVLEILLLPVYLLIAPRLLGVAVLLLLLVFYLLFPLHRSRRVLIIGYVLFFLCLVMPAGFDVARFHGPIYGNHRSGLHFVRIKYGMLNTPRCIEKYGEFVAGGCCPRGLFDPAWVLVWE
jgi:hypothetical protein